MTSSTRLLVAGSFSVDAVDTTRSARPAFAAAGTSTVTSSGDGISGIVPGDQVALNPFAAALSGEIAAIFSKLSGKDRQALSNHGGDIGGGGCNARHQLQAQDRPRRHLSFCPG